MCDTRWEVLKKVGAKIIQTFKKIVKKNYKQITFFAIFGSKKISDILWAVSCLKKKVE